MHYTSTDDIENDLRARWNDAERCLIDKAKADVLTIMDCCYASDLPSEGARARPHIRDDSRIRYQNTYALTGSRFLHPLSHQNNQ
jgi:hypothetical protein